MSFKRISLNLEHYFKDYRKLARVGIDSDIRIIGDLKEHIANVFGLERNFYLMSHNFFLPSTESIHLLNDNELISVVPNTNSDINSSYINTNKSEQSIEKVKKPKKKKCKKDKHEPDLPHIYEHNDLHESKVRKKKRKILSPEVNPIENTVKEKSWDNKEKNEVYVNITQDKMEIDNSNHKDHSNSLVNKTNIVVNETDVALPENYFEEKIRKRRRCITPLKHRITTAEILTEKIKDSPEKLIVQSVEIVEKENQLNTESIIRNSINHQSYALNDVINFNSDISSNSSPTLKPRISVHRKNKVISGVGDFLKQLQSDNEGSVVSKDSETSRNESGFITRRRIRTRKRKNKNKAENTSLEISATVFKPPNTAAAPKLHIKFTQEDEKNLNGEVEKFNDDSGTFLMHSTPIKQVNNNEHANNLNKGTNLSAISQKVKSTNIDDIAVNNILIFKRLKIGNNYNPVLSDKIVGKVIDVNDENINLQIIDGKNEFKDPVGRFSCILEEDEIETDAVIVERSSILEPRILEG